MRAETLRGAAHNNRDRRARARLENVGTRLFADAAYAQRKYNVAVERDIEVAREREEVRLDAREGGRKSCRCWGSA